MVPQSISSILPNNNQNLNIENLFTKPKQHIPAPEKRLLNGQKIRMQKASDTAMVHTLSEPATLSTTSNTIKPFTLFGLPAELREMVYHYALIPANGKIRRPHGQCRQGKQINTSIFQTCKAIYSEASNILPRNVEATIPIYKSRVTGYQLSERDHVALFRFRRLRIEWYLIKPIHYEDSGLTTVSYALKQTLPMLRVLEISQEHAFGKEITMVYCPAYRTVHISKLESDVAWFHTHFVADALLAAPSVRFNMMVGKPLDAVIEEDE